MSRKRFGGRIEFGDRRTREREDRGIESRRRPLQPTVDELVDELERRKSLDEDLDGRERR